MPEALTLSQLSSSLWKAAWHLKGSVDAADFKTYGYTFLSGGNPLRCDLRQ